jgi:hypothetical protein
MLAHDHFPDSVLARLKIKTEQSSFFKVAKIVVRALLQADELVTDELGIII